MTVCKWVLTFAHLLNWPESCCWMCCDCNQQNWAWVLCKEEEKGFKKGRRRGECKSNCPHASKQMPETCSRLSNKLSTIDPGCFVPAFPWPPLPKPASRECIRRSSSEINPVQHKKVWVCARAAWLISLQDVSFQCMWNSIWIFYTRQTCSHSFPNRAET